MIPKSPGYLVATAGALCRIRAIGIGQGPLVTELVLGAGRPNIGRWDTAFIHHVGYWSHFDDRSGRSSWPLPATTCCGELADFAADRNVLSDEPPRYGELFLLWSPSRQRFVHTGIIVGADPTNHRFNGGPQYQCQTIEANVTPTGRLDGDRMGRGVRLVSPAAGDRTIRWTDIEHYKASTRRVDTPRREIKRDIELGRVA